MKFRDRMTPPAAILIEARYCGLPGKGHGGYCAGLLAQQLGGAAEVTLRAAPPLERALHVEVQEAGGLRLWDESTVVAEAIAGSPSIGPPPPVSLEEAAIAAAAYSGIPRPPVPRWFGLRAGSTERGWAADLPWPHSGSRPDRGPLGAGPIARRRQGRRAGRGRVGGARLPGRSRAQPNGT